MFFKKDELSKFEFVSFKDFLFIILLLFLAIFIDAFLYALLPLIFERIIPESKLFFKSGYFQIFLFFILVVLALYSLYFICCKRKNRTIKDTFFLYPVSNKILFVSIMIGILMPLLTSPILFQFAPKEFYAMDMAKTKDGLIYLFVTALIAPIFEEGLYRGFLFPFIQSKSNSFWAVTITSLIFGFSHLTNIGQAYILVSLFIFYGFVLGLIRYYSNSLIPPIITHFVHNLTLIACFLLMSNIFK